MAERTLQYQQGTLSGTTIGSNLSYQELYTLDQLGNWTEFKTGSGSGWYLDQTRYHNAANEIDGNSGDPITTSTGTDWANPAYDGAGNMTTMPQPDWMAPSSAFTLKYDAWNRMVEVKSGSNTVQQNQYDGLGRRIVRSVYASGSLSFKIHYYYNERWQLLEEQKEDNMGSVASHPLNQYLWHPYYIDALAVRWYDGSTSGTQTPYYYLQDANFNVTAIANSSGQVVERGQYQAYGRVRIRNGDVDPDGDPWGIDPGEVSDVGNTHWFTGRELDPETGLQLNRQRFYSCWLGRWVTRDPILYSSNSYDLYEFQNSVPNIGTDPFGEAPVCVRCTCGCWPDWGHGWKTWEKTTNCEMSAGGPNYTYKQCCQDKGACGSDWTYGKCEDNSVKVDAAEPCANGPPQHCTFWDVLTDCSRQKENAKCNAELAACMTACAALSLKHPILGVVCVAACGGAYTGCQAGAARCINP